MTRTFEATFDGKVLIPTGPVDLPTGRPLKVTAAEEPAEEAAPQAEVVESPPPTGGTLADLADWVESLPPIEGWESPGDGAMQHDHYLYGTPKRDNP